MFYLVKSLNIFLHFPEKLTKSYESLNIYLINRYRGKYQNIILENMIAKYQKMYYAVCKWEPSIDNLAHSMLSEGRVTGIWQTVLPSDSLFTKRNSIHATYFSSSFPQNLLKSPLRRSCNPTSILYRKELFNI